MNTEQPTPLSSPTKLPKSWIADELLWVLATLFAGLLVLPAMVYVVGSRLFGAYSNAGAGLGQFYSDYAHGLASVQTPAWILALGPLVLVYLLRFILDLLPFKHAQLRGHFKNKSVEPAQHR